jgi:hypothetical protein
LIEAGRVAASRSVNSVMTATYWHVGRVIVEHELRGAHRAEYPMLPDETCWFLAVDFDKGTWSDDVRAFCATARHRGLPAVVERSRSGNGAHVWFFFAEPVLAATARKMGCLLITETMASRHELGMDSYDRLFPSQDTMPRGGFGNLIALPLQHGPRQQANSVFLDEDLQAYPDDRQWAVLASIERIAASVVERIATEAASTGSVVGVRIAESAGDDDDAPWARAPSGAPRVQRIPGPLPARWSSCTDVRSSTSGSRSSRCSSVSSRRTSARSRARSGRPRAVSTSP